ncbi:metallophosphoesterase family protein [Roseivivax isoporae]|uniref:Phospodiesterase n=1 Tax=Roseivivax isoporae LMG 25204 TaxID=1449351 RepID=X7F642_9RHOB|nr:metallophosphoesterase family protein [Roseivivax isoporae]ETX27526.1 phospodiesterase [Roseivivax isoporae LMG 25204]
MTTRLVHISDLHFGRDRPELAGPLAQFVNDADADLVVVSGDLTQRARPRQFRAARAFLDRLKAPVLTVPGNHDTPLDNVAVRLLWPWRRFRRHIARTLEPVHAADDCVVAGINTADPHAWQRGRLRTGAVDRLGSRLRGPDADGKLGVVVMHHPPEHAPGDAKQPMRGVATRLGRLAEQGADIILCGHLHVWRVTPVRAAQGLLMVQAGTGLSTRGRGEPNDLNVLDIDGPRVRVDHYGAMPFENNFALISRTVFVKEDGLWRTPE